MPCLSYDAQPTPSDLEHYRHRVKVLEALLCGVLSVVDRLGLLTTVVDSFDTKEAGVSKAALQN